MNYLSWHYLFVPKELLHIGRNFAIFFYHYFSVGELARTLFAPWKGLHIGSANTPTASTRFVDRLTFNIISRMVGAVVRTITIIIGILSEIVLIIGWLPIIVLWLILPIITIPLYLVWRRDESKKTPSQSSKKPIPARNYIQQILDSDYGRFFTTRLLLDPSELLTTIDERLLIQPVFPPHPYLIPDSKALQQYFIKHNVTGQDLQHVLQWYQRDQQAIEHAKGFWELDNLLRIPSIGKNWLYGYTPTLDSYTVPITSADIPPYGFVGRKKEIERIEQILSRSDESNVLVMGEAGVGVHALISHLGQLIAEGRVYPQLERKRLLRLDLERVFTASDRPQQKAQLTTLLDEARNAGNVVLVIDQFDRFVASKADRIDMTDVFMHAIADSRLQLIALLTPTAYEQFVHPNKALVDLFEAVEVNEPTPTQTLLILEGLLPRYEKTGVLFSYQSLKELVHLCDRYIKDIPFPEKAIDIVDTVAAYVSKRVTRIVTPRDIQEVISNRTKTPVAVAQSEKETLLNLETELHKRVINQVPAITAVSHALRRARTNVGARTNKPFGTFLFLGPTGVGKTETAKALAESFFGSETHMARFDMSEFHEEQGLRRLIGDFNSQTQGVFAVKLRENPYTLLLLDEFEKAHPQILNLFLTGLDEGYITDAFGKKVYLSTTLIIATSNAGSEFIRQRIKEGVKADALHDELIDYVQRKHIFSPELLNRFDEVVVFEPLKQKHTEKILDLFIKRLNDKLYQSHGFTINLHPSTREKVMRDGFSESFGGRALARALQKHVENPLSHMILKSQPARDSVISI